MTFRAVGSIIDGQFSIARNEYVVFDFIRHLFHVHVVLGIDEGFFQFRMAKTCKVNLLDEIT